MTASRREGTRRERRLGALAIASVAAGMIVALASAEARAVPAVASGVGAADQCHEAAAPTQPKRNGTPCDDGDACTANDSCTLGVCGGSVLPGCRLDLQSCFAASRKGPGRKDVVLDDGSGPRSYRVERPVRACAPAREAGALRDALSHLTCARITPPKGTKFAKRTLQTHDRFGDRSFTIKRPQELCAPSWPAGSAQATQLDAYVCHAVQGESADRQVTLTDERGTATVSVRRPVALCIPATVDGTPLRDGRVLLTCYDAKSPGRALPSGKITLENRLGSEELKLGKRSRLCVATTVDSCAQLTFTSVPGSPTCGGSGFEWPPAPPLIGALFDTDVGGTEIAQLGGGCAYFGGGDSEYFPAAQPASGDTLRFDATSCSGDVFPLVASPGGDAAHCIAGPSTEVKVCLNDTRRTCRVDDDCPRVGPRPNSFAFGGRCAPAPRCFSGAPFPFYSVLANACVVPVSSSSATGSVRPATGEISYALGGNNIVYINLLDFFATTPCPQCIAGTCRGGARDGLACTPSGSLNETSTDCLPKDEQFFTFVGGGVASFTTAPRSMSSPNGLFCPGQNNPGAFGLSTVRRIQLDGTPAGNLLDLAPHPATFLSLGCSGASGDPLVDSLADLPGPGASSVTGVLQLHQ